MGFWCNLCRAVGFSQLIMIHQPTTNPPIPRLFLYFPLHLMSLLLPHYQYMYRNNRLPNLEHPINIVAVGIDVKE